MADRLEIEIEISPEGEVRVETHGLKGEGCLAETQGLEAALGRVRSRQKTAEWWQRAAAAGATAKRR